MKGRPQNPLLSWVIGFVIFGTLGVISGGIAVANHEFFTSLKAKGTAALPELIELLKSPVGSRRYIAIRVLKDLGPDAKPAVPYLIESLKDHDRAIRQASAQVLGGLGADARSALPALTVAKNDLVELVQNAAEDAIRRIQSDLKRRPIEAVAAPEIAALAPSARYDQRSPGEAIDQPRGNQPPTRRSPTTMTGPGSLTMHMIGGTVSGAIGGAFGYNWLFNHRPFETGLRPTIVAAVVGAFLGWGGGVSTYTKRKQRYDALRKTGDPSAFAEIVAALEKNDLGALIACLRSDEIVVRMAAAKAIGMLGTEARRAVPALTEVLLGKMAPTSSPNLKPHQVCRNCGGRLTIWNQASHVDCVNKFADRHEAAKVLGQFGPSARSAIPALHEVANHQNLALRQDAKDALATIEQPDEASRS